MKTLFAISGSASKESSNAALLNAIRDAFTDSYTIEVFEGLGEFPLFSPPLQETGILEIVKGFRQKVEASDAVIISTPEYLHNIPAVLKNALEWLTSSGELADKPVLPITFTPAPPRGAYAMLSLLQSLKASKAKIVAELPLYRSELTDGNGTIVLDEEHCLILREALGLL